jgi:DNA-binding Lrp family transcriptional regulator
MEDLKKMLVHELIQKDSCGPKIGTIASKLGKPSSTLHYNLRKMEEEGKILGYKAVFDYKKINLGFCAFALIKLRSKVYYEDLNIIVRVAKKISEIEEVESVDVITGDWELIVKVRAKDQGEYFKIMEKITKGNEVSKFHSLISLKQIKLEHVKVPND